MAVLQNGLAALKPPPLAAIDLSLLGHIERVDVHASGHLSFDAQGADLDVRVAMQFVHGRSKISRQAPSAWVGARFSVRSAAYK